MMTALFWAMCAGGADISVTVTPLHCREPRASTAQVPSTAALERELEPLRKELGIPGMSAVIADHGRIVWAHGFGLGNVERRVSVDAEQTIFHLASLTKPYAAAVVLQLVDEGRLNLDAPVSNLGISMPGVDSVRVWHLLSHSSSGKPGTTFRYDGAAFGRLTQVVERVTGRSFAAELTDRLIRPLGLMHTAPNPRDVAAAPADDPGRRTFAASGLDRRFFEERLATGYVRRLGFRSVQPQEHATYLFASAGLVASAPDVARFSMALDEGKVLKPATRDRAFTSVRTARGDTLPYGLGWFVLRYRKTHIVWHLGQFFESSSLVAKIPAQQLTFVVLANSDGLSRGLGLGDHADVRRSRAATLFLNWCASGGRV